MRKKTVTTNPAAAPAKAAAPAPKRNRQPPASKTPVLRAEDVALRAYFISENRRQQALPGDEHQDWVEAERQLREEARKETKTAKKRTSSI